MGVSLMGAKDLDLNQEPTHNIPTILDNIYLAHIQFPPI